MAIVVWALASAAFALYVANFGSYDKTYGTLGGLVVLLVWLWITNVAILFGHALNAQLERDARKRLHDLRVERLEVVGPAAADQVVVDGTSSSTHSAPALRRSVRRLGQR